MKYEMRYAIHPDFVLSKSDGDVHYIGALQLIFLYRVAPRECLVIDDSKDRYTYARLMARAEEEGLIHLWPRYDGDYTIPTERKA